MSNERYRGRLLTVDVRNNPLGPGTATKQVTVNSPFTSSHIKSSNLGVSKLSLNHRADQLFPGNFQRHRIESAPGSTQHQWLVVDSYSSYVEMRLTFVSRRKCIYTQRDSKVGSLGQCLTLGIVA